MKTLEIISQKLSDGSSIKIVVSNDVGINVSFEGIEVEDFDESKTASLNLPIRNEFMEAIQLKSRASGNSEETVLDEILVQYFYLVGEGREILNIAKELLSIKEKTN
jgi:hypothetical protein